MTDFKEEQASEMEALQAIYGDDFKRLGGERFQVNVSDGNGHGVGIVVEYTSDYPSTLPLLSCMPTAGLTKQKAEIVSKRLLAMAKENLGSVMIFTLAQSAADILAEVAAGIDSGAADSAAAAAEEEFGGGLRKPKINEAAAIRHGKLCTRELFYEWKLKFDLERKALKMAQNAEREREKELKKDRLTGKQYFDKVSANIDWELFNPDEDLPDDAEVEDADDDDDEDEDYDVNEDVGNAPEAETDNSPDGDGDLAETKDLERGSSSPSAQTSGKAVAQPSASTAAAASDVPSSSMETTATLSGSVGGATKAGPGGGGKPAAAKGRKK